MLWLALLIGGLNSVSIIFLALAVRRHTRWLTRVSGSIRGSWPSGQAHPTGRSNG